MRLGTDIIEINRMRQVYQRNPRIVHKILSSEELQVFQNKTESQQITFLAGRFCAKEAYSKALGTGFIPPLRMSDIWIGQDKLGGPQLMGGPIIDSVLISISHSHTVATATCIIDLPDDLIRQRLLEEGFPL